ncbi:MAG: sulfotransferase [Pseudomonadales bacterium]
MSLKIIGAGFGRTGTTSMKEALELLGYNKCHHMREVMPSGKQVELFDRVSRNVEVDWDDVFEGFDAAVDWPAAARYKELMEHYPEAKVILTARDPEAWYESTRETIYAFSNSVPSIMSFLIPRARKILTMVRRLIWEGVFDGCFEEKRHAIDVYNRNVAEVIANVPGDRLLVHSAKEGWQPLCEFLDKPIPSQPYPHSNESTVMKRVIVGLKVLNVLLWILLVSAGVGLACAIYAGWSTTANF